ncbi:MAG: RNA polymerase sigma factor [bacterium]|nr:RNA polymerase sigma factor [bacterium]
MQAAIRRDPEAVEAFLQRIPCVRRILAFKNAQHGRPLGAAELDDLVQETLFSVWKKLDHYSGRGALEAWLYRFCFLEYMSRLRKLKRQPKLIEDLGGDDRSERAAPAEPSHGEYEDVYLGLERLGPPEADIIRLKHLEELTFEEIAQRMGDSPNTVKTRYYRGLARLRDLLPARSEEALPTKERREDR